MKAITLVSSVLITLLGQAGHAAAINGFTSTVECEARSINGGHPANASSIQLGSLKTDGNIFYVFSQNTIRVGLFATEIRPDASGLLKADLIAKHLENEHEMLYAKLTIQFDRNGNGQGKMESVWANSEPYVLGSLILSNCKIH